MISKQGLMAVCVLSGLTLSACGNFSAPSLAAGNPPLAAAGKYDVQITRTSLGIPHVKADDFGSLGYGLGYSFAEDNLCVLMEDLVTIRGERAKYFGRNGPTYTLQVIVQTPTNIDSDFFWKAIASNAAIQPFKDHIVAEGKLATTGYMDGFNRYIREIQAGAHPGRHASCRNAPWLAEISEDDLYRRYFRLAILASSSAFINGIATAQPPVGGSSGAAAPPALTPAQMAQLDPSQFPVSHDLPFGSNMFAIGPDFTENGVPIQFVNPHFPWLGSERLYLTHLTVPGRMDIMGAALYGVPAILIGFNDHLAWSHTVSFAYRFSFYELTLAPGDPTAYVYNGAAMKMMPVPMKIDVKEDDGTMTTATRTLYRSKFGPMLTFSVNGANILPWSTSKAYTLRDANAENDRLLDQFFAWDQARSLDEFKSLHKSVLGIPWVNTTASSPDGAVYYGDLSTVPNVPDSMATRCSTSAQAQALAQLAPGLPLLDGSRSDCEWLDDADAPAPGIFGPSHLPTLERRDWVGNFNDSHWLTNPAQPLTGYARIIGPEGTARTLRTRLGILKMLNRAGGSDGRPGKKWNTETLKDSVLDSHIYSADLAVSDVTGNLCATGTVTSSSGAVVDVSKACAVLAAWDKSNNLDSVGGHIWREFWNIASVTKGFYLIPFSASDPVNTPRDINTASPQVRSALGDAVKLIQDSGIALDAKLRDIQHSAVNDFSIPLFGGIGNTEGAFTIANPRGPITKQGYPIAYGNSFVSVITWDQAGVKADGFITYSQSSDPANPHHADFTREYSAKRWKRLPFHDAEIQADKIGEVRLMQ